MSYNDIECPYCNKGMEICHDDGHGCIEDKPYEEQCPECEKYFVFYSCISFDYTPQKADCLNGSEHDYEVTSTIPNAFSKMRCKMCDEEREMTEPERIALKIGTKAEYMKSIGC